MPRGPRLDAPGSIHHLMVRGVDRRRIFLDDTDRADFARRLDRLIPELGFVCFAWALMSNHVHLVVRTGPVSVSRLMARLGTGYARRFNERHDRVGHLFQNRFRSRLANDDADLLGLVLYVNRNPLEAGMVHSASELERFPWCGHGALTATRPARRFEAIEAALTLFDSDPRRARDCLRRQIDDSAPEVPSMNIAVSRLPTLPNRNTAITTSLAELRKAVCARLGVVEGELLDGVRSRKVVAARVLLAEHATRELGLTAASIGRELGVSGSAVAQMLRRSRLRPRGVS